MPASRISRRCEASVGAWPRRFTSTSTPTPRSDVWRGLPNLLTGLRIALIPIIVLLFYLPMSWSNRWAGILFLIAGVTDSLDGWIARRTGQVSPLGTFLDPVADKLIVATALVLIVSRDHEWYLALAAAVIVGREITISALREWMAEIGARRKVAVSSLGKLKTVAQILGIALLLYRDPFLGLPTYGAGLVLTALAAVLTLWSMALYLRAAWPDLKRSGNS